MLHVESSGLGHDQRVRSVLRKSNPDAATLELLETIDTQSQTLLRSMRTWSSREISPSWSDCSKATARILMRRSIAQPAPHLACGALVRVLERLVAGHDISE
ncbi:MAG: hypothetical protein DMF93_12470 [Acidobacteria bacterium]|nr:MAG: hypothetical protein DMF93_12470 [Acidobacteriota bacterium]